MHACRGHGVARFGKASLLGSCLCTYHFWFAVKLLVDLLCLLQRAHEAVDNVKLCDLLQHSWDSICLPPCWLDSSIQATQNCLDVFLEAA